MLKPTLVRQRVGMGSRARDCYAGFIRRMRFEEDVERIQALPLSGK
ncbi:MAG: hypothetical protein KDI17_01185 [Halioglobus sp.]|nr:hypothetical protein [Halioglobus sp.]